MTISVNCPHCKSEVNWDAQSPFKPFCSERCRLQDLGAWFTEEHKISEKIPMDESLSMDADDLESLIDNLL